MTKRNIRLLASGFFISGLLLTAFQTMNGTTVESGGSESTEAVEADLRVMEEKAVQLELENEQLREEYDKLVAMQSGEFNETEESEDFSENQEADTTEETEEMESTDETSEEESSASATEYTIVVAEGEPSSVIASQLERHGLIDDFFEFNDYLEANDLIRRVRPGEFTVHSDMNRAQIIEAIIR